ncbi:hypothetical protein QQS21_000124 [Conoideocrella luteorostrata]|uniref:Uncharacterized protein n=1 Tax=Conoideocrella luteorostrata TaxID=1105319 RepID=A0AAJ0FZL9_9HYPO|nr:hypothetical protein QQS21_000124 [Conoideocrella luteorostrata]
MSTSTQATKMSRKPRQADQTQLELRETRLQHWLSDDGLVIQARLLAVVNSTTTAPQPQHRRGTRRDVRVTAGERVGG